MKILIINGPNINMLGIREKHIYGTQDYNYLIGYIKDECEKRNIQPSFFQSNYEGAIVESIQQAYEKIDGIVINPAAYTHTSIAILDALKAVSIPTVEVHISKVSERESFRHISYPGMACIKTYAGYGFDGYIMAIDYLADYLKSREAC